MAASELDAAADYAAVHGSIFAHRSNRPTEAHSRMGYFPEGEVEQVTRRLAQSYAENLDQPQRGAGWHRRVDAAAAAAAQQGDFNLGLLFPALRSKKAHELPGVLHLTKQARSSQSRSPPRQPATPRFQSAPPAAAASPADPSAVVFDSTSPLSTYHSLRSERDTGLMTALSPRSLGRALVAQQQQSAQQQQQMQPYHPSLHAQPSTRAHTAPYAHRRPWLPSSRAEARSIFAQPRGLFLDGAPLDDGAGQAGPQRRSGSSTERATSAVSSSRRSGSATSRTSLSTFSPLPSRSAAGKASSSAPARPFCPPSSARVAASLTEIDYFLNSADSRVKRLERAWLHATSGENRRLFLERLRQTQQAERELQRQRAVKEGRVLITESLPPRPLALDNFQDLNRIRYLGD